MLSESQHPLHESHDLAMLDLDGVVYIGAQAVPGAPTYLREAGATGLRLAFVTNNAARTPATVARHLAELGVPAAAEDVVTSAQAAAHLLAEQLPSGSPVYLLGSAGLEEALRAEGLRPVWELADDPVAVVSGYDPDLVWKRLMQGAVLIRDGLPWVAANTDRTVPMPYGLGPGHGTQVQLLSDFAGVAPVVAGKPARPLLDETIRRVGGTRPLMVGDRLDTDIEGANTAGIDSLLVMTGVTDLDELVRAPAAARPSFLAADLGGLLRPHAVPVNEGGVARLGGWSATVVDGILEVTGTGSIDDRWRVSATAAWSHLDRTGEPVR